MPRTTTVITTIRSDTSEAVTILSTDWSVDSGTITLTANVPATVRVGDLITDVSSDTYLIVGLPGGAVLDCQDFSTTADPATSGAATITEAYDTITLWEADLDSPAGAPQLYISGDIAQGEMYNTTPFDEQVAVNGGDVIGLTTRILTVPVSERHDGVEKTGARMVRTSGGTTFTFLNTQMKYEFEWLAIDINGQSAACVDRRLSTNTEFLDLRNVIGHGSLTNSISLIAFIGNTWRVMNCMSFDHEQFATNVRPIVGFGDNGSVRPVEWYNITCHDIRNIDGTGECFGFDFLDSSTLTHIIRNCIATDVTGTTSGPIQCYSVSNYVLATSTNNLSSDTTASGVGSLPSEPSVDLFVSNTSPYDLHLKSGANAIGAGFDVGTTPTGVNFDIDNEDRTGLTWDIGADQFVVAGDSADVTQLLQQVNQAATATGDLTGAVDSTQTLQQVTQAATATSLETSAVDITQTIGITGGAFSEGFSLGFGVGFGLTQSSTATGILTVGADSTQLLPQLAQASAAQIATAPADVIQNLRQINQAATASPAPPANVAQSLRRLAQRVTVQEPELSDVTQTLQTVLQAATSTAIAAAGVDVVQTIGLITQSSTVSEVPASAVDSIQTLSNIAQLAVASEPGVAVAGITNQLLAIAQASVAVPFTIADTTNLLQQIAQEVTSVALENPTDVFQSLLQINQTLSATVELTLSDVSQTLSTIAQASTATAVAVTLVDVTQTIGVITQSATASEVVAAGVDTQQTLSNIAQIAAAAEPGIEVGVTVSGLISITQIATATAIATSAVDTAHSLQNIAQINGAFDFPLFVVDVAQSISSVEQASTAIEIGTAAASTSQLLGFVTQVAVVAVVPAKVAGISNLVSNVDQFGQAFAIPRSLVDITQEVSQLEQASTAVGDLTDAVDVSHSLQNIRQLASSTFLPPSLVNTTQTLGKLVQAATAVKIEPFVTGSAIVSKPGFIGSTTQKLGTIGSQVSKPGMLGGDFDPLTF